MSEPGIALITGASGGLGRVLASDLAAEGWSLVLVGSDSGRLDAVRSEIGLDRSRTLTVEADLRDAASTKEAIDAAYDEYGQVDALAHLVGGWTGGMNVGRSPDDPYQEMIDQHLWTPLNVTRVLAPRMADAGRGRIVAVSSPMAVNASAGMSAYGAGKAALEALFTALAKEVGEAGVTVNVLRVLTIDSSAADPATPSSNPNATTAAEISAAIRYLFSDAARTVNGRHLDLYPLD